MLGASGGIGQPLSLLLKLSPLISDLSLYDIQHTKGVGADLSHIETRPKVKAYVGKDELAHALTGMDLVVIPAGVPRKPGRDISLSLVLCNAMKTNPLSARHDTR